ncbi:MAG: VWA domain-containing protein [Deltaproteobacteria bacterium]|nr:MAG: VWA domain-containing protein [Deltaproteobacteria bacterium]
MTGRRLARLLAPVAYTLLFALPTAYGVLWAIDTIYEVPLRVDSFRFERPWAGLLIPAALVVLIARGYLQRFAAPRLLVSRGHTLAKGPRGRRVWAQDSTVGMRVTATALLAFALMGPQSIHARDRAELEGIDIVLTLDASLSMQAADVQPNRFAATQAVVDDFIRRRPNDRIGAVIFGRDAYTLLPLTTDKEALRTMIMELTLGMIDGRGTAIGNAVATALNRLRDSEAESKVIILLTDGDSNSGNVSPDQAAEFASVMGVKVFTILMGQSDEARVQRGTGFGGRPIFDVGNFPVNPELLRDMAEHSGGEFYHVTNRQGLERTFHAILDTLEKSELEDLGRVYGEIFPAFLWPAFFLLALELFAGAILLRRWP